MNRGGVETCSGVVGFEEDSSEYKLLMKHVKVTERIYCDGTPVMCLHACKPCNDDVFLILLKHVTRFLNMLKLRRRPFYMLLDVREESKLSLEQVMEVCKLVCEWRKMFRKYLRGTMILVYSPTLKTILDTALSVFPPSRPLQTQILEKEVHLDASLSSFGTANDFFKSLETEST